MYLKKHNQNIECYIVQLTLKDSPIVNSKYHMNGSNIEDYSKSYMFFSRKEAIKYRDRILSIKYEAINFYLSKLIKYYTNTKRNPIEYMLGLFYASSDNLSRLLREELVKYRNRHHSYLWEMYTGEGRIILDRLDFLTRLSIQINLPILKNDEGVLNTFLNYMEKND